MSSITARHHPIRAHGQTRRGTQPGRFSTLSALRRWLRLEPSTSSHAPMRNTSISLCDDNLAAQFAAADRLLSRADEEGCPVTVLVLELNDLPEVEYLFGARLAKHAVAKTSTKLRQVAGRGGTTLPIDSVTSAVILPGVESKDVLERMQAQFGKPCCLELDDEAEDVVLVPDFALQTVDGPAPSFERLVAALRRQIEDARSSTQRREDYLKRERESHTRPMGLTGNREPALDESSCVGEMYPRTPPTIAMPLAPR